MVVCFYRSLTNKLYMKTQVFSLCNSKVYEQKSYLYLTLKYISKCLANLQGCVIYVIAHLIINNQERLKLPVGNALYCFRLPALVYNPPNDGHTKYAEKIRPITGNIWWQIFAIIYSQLWDEDLVMPLNGQSEFTTQFGSHFLVSTWWYNF